MPFVTNSIFFSCFFTPVMFVFLRQGLDRVLPPEGEAGCPFSATENVQREDLRPGQRMKTGSRAQELEQLGHRDQETAEEWAEGSQARGSPGIHLDRHSWLQLKKSLTCSQALK